MATKTYTPRLADKYSKEVVPALMKKFGYKTIMQAPKLTKICLNRGVNGAVSDKKLVDIAVDELTNITGQKAMATIDSVGAIPELYFSNSEIHNENSPLGWSESMFVVAVYLFYNKYIKPEQLPEA